MDKYDREHQNNLIKAINDVDEIFNKIISDIITALVLLHLSDDKPFYFRNHPDFSKNVDQIIKKHISELDRYVSNKSKQAWGLANKKNDSLVDNIYKTTKKTPPQILKQSNQNALKTVLNRKIGDLTVSQRVWNLTGTTKKEIESCISAAIEKGQSADSLARSIKKYLINPDARFRKVRDKFGNLKLSANALSYHPGQGVYRSAYKNAMRLARNEINVFYRRSDWERWQQTPFITGFKIQNSNRVATVCPICQRFDGKIFPKDFYFIGFHVQCACSAIPVFAKQEDIDKYIKGQDINPEQPDYPQEWLDYEEEQREKQAS